MLNFITPSDWPKPDRLQPCLHSCSSFPKDRADLLFYQESLELLLIPWRLQSNLLSSLCSHCPSRQDPNPHQDILQGTYTHLEISGTSDLRGRSPDRCSHQLVYIYSLTNFMDCSKQQDTPEWRATIQKYFNKLEDLSTRRCRTFNKGKCTQSLEEK